MRRILFACAATLVACGLDASPEGHAVSDAGAPPPSAASGDAAATGDGGSTSQPDANGSRPDASASDGPLFRQAADRGELAAFTLDEAIVAADGALEIASGGGHPGTDPYGAGNWHGGNFYNGGSYAYAIATSPVHVFRAPFDSVTPSFEATTPPGTWVHVKLEARVAGRWTKAYSLGVWAQDTATVARHSVDAQGDADGDVQTDTLVLNQKADALRIVVVLLSAQSGVTPRVRAVSAITEDTSAPLPSDTPDHAAWGTVLDVPKRSQMIYANGGEVWCSPTSVSMLLAYWSAKLAKPELVETVPTAADRTYDWIYAGNGNWPFNTAHAASMGAGALHAMVTRMASFAQIERLVAAGIPAAISVAYQPGELSGSPIPSTDGHLIVARGIASNGDIVCNDPAFSSNDAVEVTYKRDELERAWGHSNKTTYVVWPIGTALPFDPLGAF